MANSNIASSCLTKRFKVILLYSRLQPSLSLSQWEEWHEADGTEWRWGAESEMDGEKKGGDRREPCRGGSGCWERATVADALPATSPSLLMSESLCDTQTHAHMSTNTCVSVD